MRDRSHSASAPGTCLWQDCSRELEIVPLSPFPHSATGQPLLCSKWGTPLGTQRHRLDDRRPRDLQNAAGDVVLLHDADHYGTRESWRVTAAALRKISDRIAAV